jgi:hypothetical protein
LAFDKTDFSFDFVVTHIPREKNRKKALQNSQNSNLSLIQLQFCEFGNALFSFFSFQTLIFALSSNFILPEP